MDSVTNGGSAAIQRAALLARMIPSLARNQVPVSMADAALGGKSAPQHTVPMPQGAAVPPAAAPPAEDAVQDSGDAIDTFSSYIPTALPPCIVDILREKIAENNASSSSTADSLSKSEEKHEVIEILDTDNEDPCMEMEVSVKAPLSSTKSDDATKDMQSRSNRTDTETTSSLFTNTSIQSHTSPAVESALLSSVSAPPVPNEAAEVVLPLVREGKLSPLQAEGVCLAVNRFRRVFGRMGSGRYDGAVRAGFFIGDGAGIGKGRQISATLLDAISRNHGRGRHLWISVSRELVQDAKRDLSDIGCYVSVHDGGEILDQMSGGKKAKGLGAGSSLGKGVLFITYSLLVSGKRMEDIIAWLANTSTATGKGVDKVQERTRLEQSYSGCIVFDEAHKAKNLEQDTRTAKLVLALQDRLPNARVLYCSATGVSDIKHMVYANRLGLWGSANPLYPTFDVFQNALAKRGVGAMEMLALEMKRKGIFLARTLSWDGAEFHTLEVNLNRDQIGMYDGAVRWWMTVKGQMEASIQLVGASKTLWRTYWSAHQRFFKEMCICSKIDEVVKQAKKYLESNDHAIVIGLQSTGEAGMEVALEELAEAAAEKAGKKVRRNDNDKIDFEDMSLSGLVSTCASIMTNFVRNHFPVAPPAPELPKIPPNGFASEAERLEHAHLTDLADRIKNEPPPPPIPELVEKRNRLLEAILDLALPPNPLDDLIDRLGGVDNVAEMTGRSGRILRNKNGQYRYVKRFGGPSKQKSYALSMPVSREDEQDRLNIVEKRKFMEGKKSVAIISDAASTGISLHADRRCPSSHKRRVHFTIELPWSADKAIQQLGRSHRSGQTTAPIYKMVVTELGGERRFASAVSKRMAQLGALTKGDRRAASGSDLSDFDIDSSFGRRALVRYLRALTEQPKASPARNCNDILDKFIATRETIDNKMEKDEEMERASALDDAADALTECGLASGTPSVKKFLNRIAGLDVSRQNLVFSLFMATLDDVITDAKATGEWEGSVEDIRATNVVLKGKPEVIVTDTSCGADTELTRLVIDRGISFNTMIQNIIDNNAESYTARHDDMSYKDDGEEEEQCKSGFYISRRKVTGRFLVMFAERKVQKDDDADSDFIDPLNLMIITRPNTGKNPCEMASEELRYKYKLLVSVDQIINQIYLDNRDDVSEEKKDDSIVQTDDTISAIRNKWGNVGYLWDDAFDNSNFSKHNEGLAPRISEMGLITGAVLHILPSLEKAVQFMPTSQRALRVMRAELSDTGERIVGVKFPVSEQAIERLMTCMREIVEARQGSLDAPSFVDESFSPVDEKTKSWAIAERKTMKSFFGAATPKASSSKSSDTTSTSSGALNSGKRKESGSASITPSLNGSVKKQKPVASVATKTKKTASLTSFFGKK